MSDVTLGAPTAALSLRLVDPAPLHAALTADDPWPAPPELILDTWPEPLVATVNDGEGQDGRTAVWSWSAEQVAAICATRPKVATLRNPGDHHVYAAGKPGNVHVQKVAHLGDASTLPPSGELTVETIDGQVHIHYHTGEGSGSISDAQIAALLGDPGSATHAALTAALSSGGSVHLGEGPPPDLIVGAKVKDIYIDTLDGTIYTLGA